MLVDIGFSCSISRQLQAVKRFKELFDIEALAKTLCNEAMARSARSARSRNVKMQMDQMAITTSYSSCIPGPGTDEQL